MASHGGLEARQDSRWSKFPVLPIAPYMNAIGTGRTSSLQIRDHCGNQLVTCRTSSVRDGVDSCEKRFT